MSVDICTATLLVDPMRASDDQVRVAAEAALAAGFTGASVWAQHVTEVAASGLRVTALEAATRWANGDAAAASTEASFFADAVRSTGARTVLAVCMDATLDDVGRARANLDILSTAVGQAGAQVCVEFLPWSPIASLADAWALIEPLQFGTGITLDTWHWVRQPGGPDLELLRRIPGDRIGYVQLCDAAPVRPAPFTEDLLTEAMTARLLPGAGIVDFPSVVDALATIGSAPMFATEVFNTELVRTHGAAASASSMRRAAQAVGFS